MRPKQITNGLSCIKNPLASCKASQAVDIAKKIKKKHLLKSSKNHSLLNSIKAWLLIRPLFISLILTLSFPQL